jgi:hypothetical protein
MRPLLLGNPDTDFIQFGLDDVSRKESVIAVSGDVRAGFFSAQLYLLIRPAELEEFVGQLGQLDQSLAGSAVLRAEGPENVVEIALEGIRRGHVLCRGNAAVNGNTLSFRFQTDQTQLGVALRWFKAVHSRHQEASAVEGAG